VCGRFCLDAADDDDDADDDDVGTWRCPVTTDRAQAHDLRFSSAIRCLTRFLLALGGFLFLI